MTSIYWQRRLDAASSARDVVVIANAFVANLTPTEIAKLPIHCRPPEIASAADIARYAYVLVREYCGDHSATQRLVNSLAEFFSAASIRVAQIAGYAFG